MPTDDHHDGEERDPAANVAGAEVDDPLGAMLGEEPDLPPAPTGRPSRGSPALRPRDDTEKTLALEMGRLFGINPRTLVSPDAGGRPRPDTDSTDSADDSEAGSAG